MAGGEIHTGCASIGFEQRLSASLEDYLEAILRISDQKHAARPKDIAIRLKVNSSSVTGALQNLAKRGLVNYAPYDLITLTDAGEEVARDIVRRHEGLRDFFQTVLAVDRTEAEKAACRLEHAISRPILKRLTEFVDFVKTCPRGGTGWIQQFRCKCEDAGRPRDCQTCVQRCIEDVFGADRTRTAAGEPHETTLAALRAGERGEVVLVQGSSPTHRRLRDMGVTAGAMAEVNRVSSAGSPIDVTIKGYHFSLDSKEASGIIVSVL